jgi:FKBP-type peptidyl-prolyl cis-trans isomerase
MWLRLIRRSQNMAKILVAVIIVVVLAAATVWAQTSTHKSAPAARPNTAAPSKVTGDGVKTASGLQYWDIKVGAGAEAKNGSPVKVHYTGWLTTGKKFDSSVDAHTPFDFTIGQGDVIKGWDEGVSGMKSAASGNCGFRRTWATARAEAARSRPTRP